MPDGCILQFDPIIARPPDGHAGVLNDYGDTLGDSRQRIELDSFCRTFRGWPTVSPVTGNTRLAACDCEGVFCANPVIDPETGNLIWEEAGPCESSPTPCGPYQFPAYIKATPPSSIPVFDSGHSAGTGYFPAYRQCNRGNVAPLTHCIQYANGYVASYWGRFALRYDIDEGKLYAAANRQWSGALHKGRTGSNGDCGNWPPVPCDNTLVLSDVFASPPQPVFYPLGIGWTPWVDVSEFIDGDRMFLEGSTSFVMGISGVAEFTVGYAAHDGPQSPTWTYQYVGPGRSFSSSCCNCDTENEYIIWQQYGCTPRVECPDGSFENTPITRCCIDDDCYQLTEELCENLGGTSTPDEPECQVGFSPPTFPCSGGPGACCFEDAGCFEDFDEATCFNAGGIFAGSGSTCDDIECGIGACCFPSGGCSEIAQASCEAQGGTFQGKGVACADIECECTGCGACCEAGTGICYETTANECNGVFHGVGTSCGPVNPCDSTIGACCLQNGIDCIVTSATTCGAIGGTFHVNQGCGGNVCGTNPLAACCLPDGTCVNLTQSSCAAAGGEWFPINTCGQGGFTCIQPPS